MATNLPGTGVLLIELLSPDRIRVPIRAASKNGVLEELVDTLLAVGVRGAREEVLGAVREREAVLSTGIGNGVAIPHGKSATVTELVLAVGVSEQPIDFDALDGEPVRLFFMLVGPEAAAGAHIKALSRISRLVRREDVRDRLLAARSAEELYASLRDSETA